MLNKYEQLMQKTVFDLFDFFFLFINYLQTEHIILQLLNYLNYRFIPQKYTDNLLDI